jgi:inorganic phosphate transporter, PiT family
VESESVLIELMIFAATVMLAYANGANDNFKGVATLYGSGVLSYRTAKLLSTVATIFGALAAVMVAAELARAFSGRGLVADSVVAQPAFAAAVALAAGATVLLATRIGMPISTTHALVGGLAGAGWMASSDALKTNVLLALFVMPLLLGPLIAVLASALLNMIARKWWSERAADESCACVAVNDGSNDLLLANSATAPMAAVASPQVSINVGRVGDPACGATADSQTMVLTESRLINALHVASGALVCFARGLNDAPKIAGLLLVVSAVGGSVSTGAVAVAMALGGWLHSRRIADTMAHKISTLEPRSSFLANVCTACLVISATKFGLPLSTTHVSVGAIAGVSLASPRDGGSASGVLSRSTLKHIGLAWVFTLPISALFACLAFSALSLFFR